MVSSRVAIILGLSITLILIVAITVPAVLKSPQPAGDRGTIDTGTQNTSQPGIIYRVRIGLLRTVDAVPFIIAYNENLFSKYGVNASIEVYGSARDRDTAMISGLIDLSLNDPITSLILVDRGVNVKIVSLLLGQDPRDIPISILLLPGSLGNVTCVEEIAISRNTIIEFTAWKLLEHLGCDPRSVRWVDVPSITNRFQLLIEGKVKAATLPQPWNVLAVDKGARILINTADLNKQLAMSVILAKSDLADPDFIKRIRSALNEALDLYRANPAKYRDLVERSISIPEELRGRWLPEIRGKITDYPKENFDLVASWLLERGLISRKPSYSDVVVSIG